MANDKLLGIRVAWAAAIAAVPFLVAAAPFLLGAAAISGAIYGIQKLMED